MRFAKLWMCLGVLLAAVLSYADLTVGMEAPLLKPVQWLKGKKIPEKNLGRMTVVLFFSSWNEASTSTFESFSEIKKSFESKADFVAISTWEQEPSAIKQSVIPLIKDMADEIDFSVAADNIAGHMAYQWLSSSGLKQVPAIFVVDTKGKIAWFGYPQGILRNILKKLDKGEWDYEKAKIECEKMRNRPEITGGAPMWQMNSYQKAMAEKNYSKALDLLNKEIAENPKNEPDLEESKLWLLTRTKNSQTEAYFKKIIDTKRTKDCNYLNLLIWTVIEDDLNLSSSLYQACEDAARVLWKRSPDDALHLDTVALAMWRNRKKAEALQIQTEAIRLSKNQRGIDPTTLMEMRQRLELYSKANQINPSLLVCI